jgi:hypothetical protein
LTNKNDVYVFVCPVCKERYATPPGIGLSEAPWHQTDSHLKEMKFVPEESVGTPAFLVKAPKERNNK